MLAAVLLGITCSFTSLDDVAIIDTVLGKGLDAAKGDSVTIGYKGWLQSSGEVFDESKGKAPFVFTLGNKQAIAGMEIGVAGLKVGGKRIVLIPPADGYGEKGIPGRIPGGATLAFEIELLRVEKSDYKPVIEIELISEGSGPAAKAGDTVEVHYTGTFLNGHKFDSSRDRNAPFPVELGKSRVIKGFEEGLIGMKAGGIRKVTIPYHLAYGEAGRPPVIPPKSTLVFELEVLKITSPDQD